MRYNLNMPTVVPPKYRPLGALVIDPNTGLPVDTSSSSTSSASTSGGGTSTTPSWLNTLVTGVTDFALSAQQAKNIDQLNQINIQRAAQGLPPLNVPIAGAGVQVGASPALQTALYVGLGIAAVFVVGSILKRR